MSIIMSIKLERKYICMVQYGMVLYLKGIYVDAKVSL